jgi:hypothetical protein
MKEDKRKNNDLWNSIQKNKVKETEEQEPHKILGENWGAPDGYTVSALLMGPVVL